MEQPNQIGKGRTLPPKGPTLVPPLDEIIHLRSIEEMRATGIEYNERRLLRARIAPIQRAKEYLARRIERNL